MDNGPEASTEGTGGLSRRIARLLDTLIKIPGTNFRIGLDPIIGLIPGVGDAISAALGSIILADAARRKLPARLLVRMGGNVVLNAVVGAVPLLGDLFSAWFRSNSRNYAILHAYTRGEKNPPAGPRAKWIVTACVLLLVLLAAFCILAVWLFARLWDWAR